MMSHSLAKKKWSTNQGCWQPPWAPDEDDLLGPTTIQNQPKYLMKSITMLTQGSVPKSPTQRPHSQTLNIYFQEVEADTSKKPTE